MEATNYDAVVNLMMVHVNSLGDCADKQFDSYGDGTGGNKLKLKSNEHF